MTIAVTGASGQLGRLVADQLLATVDPSEVDALAVLRDAGAASRLLDAGNHRGAAELCASTLSRYRGEVLPAAGDSEWVRPHRARLEEARRILVETGFSARLRLGGAADVIASGDVWSVRWAGCTPGASCSAALTGTVRRR